MSINAYFLKLIANLIIKNSDLKNATCLIFKQKWHILTHNMNNQNKITGDFGLHKLIFVLL